MRYFAILLLALLLVAMPFASFTYLYSMNGSGSTDYGTSYQFQEPSGLLAENGVLFVTDMGHDSLYAINDTVPAGDINGTQLVNGTPRLYFVSKYGSSASNFLTDPMHMAYDGGLLYIADGASGSIFTYTGRGPQVSKWNSGSDLQTASGVALDSQYMYIADSTKQQLVAYSLATKSYSSTAISAGLSDGQLSAPADVKIYDGEFFISDSGKGLIFVYGQNFTYLQAIGRNILSSPQGMQIYGGRIFIADASRQAVYVFSMDGYLVDTLNSSDGANFSRPADVAIDNGKLFVADAGSGLVDAFSINETVGDQQVLQLIGQANQSVAALSHLQSAASALGIPVSPNTFPSDLATAQAYYDDSGYSAAQTVAQNVLSNSSSQQQDLAQQIDISIKQLIATAQGQVAPYQNSSGGLSSQLSGFNANVSLVQSELHSQSYSQAAQGALGLSGQAEAFVQAANESSSQAALAQQQAEQNSLLLQISALSSRESALEAEAEAYHEPLNLSSTDALLSSAQNYTESMDFGSANYSISLATADIGSYEASVSQLASQSDAALANISVVGFELNTTISELTLLPPDYSPEQKLMAQAESTAYQNPALAMAMAQQAYASAQSKQAESQKISIAVIFLAIMLFLIVLLSAVFYLHLRGRKKSRQKTGL